MQARVIGVDRAVHHAVEQRASARLRRARSWTWRSRRLHIIGVSVSDTTAEVTTAIVKVSANSRNMRPTMPVMNSSGMNTAISDTRERDHREADLLGAGERRVERLFAVLHVADDVLDHDDRIVDHEAGADGQRHQRKIVEREAAEPHHAERGDERQRQRHARR